MSDKVEDVGPDSGKRATTPKSKVSYHLRKRKDNNRFCCSQSTLHERGEVPDQLRSYVFFFDSPKMDQVRWKLSLFHLPTKARPSKGKHVSLFPVHHVQHFVNKSIIFFSASSSCV